MKRLIFILLGLLIFTSCSNINKKEYIIGSWEFHTIINYEGGDTLYHDITHINFTDSGYVFFNKYRTEEYYVFGDSLITFYNGKIFDEWVSNRYVSYINIINDSIFTLNDGHILFQQDDINKPTKYVIDTTQVLKPEFDTSLSDDILVKNEIFKKYYAVKDTNPEYPYETILQKRSGHFFYKRVPKIKEEVYDKILINLSLLNSEEIPIFITPNDKSILGDGRVFFNFRIYGNSYFIEPKIKGSIDRTLGILPKNETRDKYSRWERSFMNKYEWETLDMRVLMENYHKRSSYNDRSYLQVKIWITLK